MLKPQLQEVLILNALELVDKEWAAADVNFELKSLCVKILINLCSLTGTRVYIPGETNVAAQLRKRSFECGAYIALV